MKMIKKLLAAFTVLIVTTGLFVACSNGAASNHPDNQQEEKPAEEKKEPVEEKIAVESVKIASPISTDLKKGATLALDTTVLPANATDKTVTWSSSDTSVATVTSAGVVTGVKAGKVTITATSGNKTDSVELQITHHIYAEATNSGFRVTVILENDEELRANSGSCVKEVTTGVELGNGNFDTELNSKKLWAFDFPFTQSGKEYTFIFNGVNMKDKNHSDYTAYFWESVTYKATTTTKYANAFDFTEWNKLKPTVDYDYYNKKVYVETGLTEEKFNDMFKNNLLSKKDLYVEFLYGLIDWTDTDWIDNFADSQLKDYTFKNKAEFNVTLKTDTPAFSKHGYKYSGQMRYTFKLTDFDKLEWNSPVLPTATVSVFDGSSPDSGIIGTWTSSDKKLKLYLNNDGTYYGCKIGTNNFSYTKGVYTTDKHNTLYIKVQQKNKNDFTTEQNPSTLSEWTKLTESYLEYYYGLIEGQLYVVDCNNKDNYMILKK